VGLSLEKDVVDVIPLGNPPCPLSGRTEIDDVAYHRSASGPDANAQASPDIGTNPLGKD
jgi:hypothetical protein